MKKNYIKPEVEMLDFKLDEAIMSGESGSLDGMLSGGEEGVEDAPF